MNDVPPPSNEQPDAEADAALQKLQDEIAKLRAKLEAERAKLKGRAARPDLSDESVVILPDIAVLPDNDV